VHGTPSTLPFTEIWATGEERMQISELVLPCYWHGTLLQQPHQRYGIFTPSTGLVGWLGVWKTQLRALARYEFFSSRIIPTQAERMPQRGKRQLGAESTASKNAA